MVHAHCMQATKEIIRIYNTHCFSTATIVARTPLNVTLCVHCLSCFLFLSLLYVQPTAKATRELKKWVPLATVRLLQTVRSTTVIVVVMNRYEWYESRIKCVGNRVSLRHVTARMNFLVKLNHICVVKHNLMQNEKENYK